MLWLKIMTADDLFDRLDAEVAQTHAAMRSGCKLPTGERCDVVAWCPALPRLPAMQHLKALPPANQSLLKHFRNWLHLSGYSAVGRLVYGHAARLVFSVLNRDWRELVPDKDLPPVCDYINVACPGVHAAQHLCAGVAKLGEYLRVRQVRRLLPRGKLAHVSWPATDIPADNVLAALGPLLEHDSDISGCVAVKPAEGQRRRYVKSKCLSRPLRAQLKPSGLHLIPVKQWPQANQALYQGFRNWLNASGYSPSAVYLYGLATRVAFSLLKQDWRALNPETDFAVVHAWLHAHYTSEATRQMYAKGLDKLQQYVLRRQGKTRPVPAPRCTPLGLPSILQDSLVQYERHCQRNWPHERVHEIGPDWWSKITLPLRLMCASGVLLEQPSDLTPTVWFAYLDARLAQGLTPRTLNGELSVLKGWLRWLDEGNVFGLGDEAAMPAAMPMDRRMLRLKPVRESQRLPKDVPPDDVLKLQRVIELESLDATPHTRRRGVMDLAWFLLMVHSGLRTGEVRRLKPHDIDWSRRQIRIEASKHLRSRLAPMSLHATEALNNWITRRGDNPDLPETVFLDRHRPLSQSYCYSRLQTYASRCNVKVHPHQLRHSCATLLLNAGMPLPQVQVVLGHVSIETTRGYARSYDGTVAADYTRAMLSVEHDLGLAGDSPASTMSQMSQAEIITLLDSLKTTGVLNSQQLDTLALVRAGLLGLAAPPRVE